MNPLVNFFAWIRRKTAEAVLGGVADACEALDADPTPLNGMLPDALRGRLDAPPALPAPGRRRRPGRQAQGPLTAPTGPASILEKLAGPPCQPRYARYNGNR
jgi:hypothetical protein